MNTRAIREMTKAVDRLELARQMTNDGLLDDQIVECIAMCTKVIHNFLFKTPWEPSDET